MKSEKFKAPQHVAIIMDGNGRWAKKKGLARIEGHKSARAAIRHAIIASQELQVRYLSLFAFSTENWKRPDTEIYPLFSIFTGFLIEETPELHKNHVKINTCGNLERFPTKMKKEVTRACELTRDNDGLYLNICLDYSGKEDILHAVKQIVKREMTAEEVTEEVFESSLRTGCIPPVDLLIRTSGEQRISNFMLWQIAYAELYFEPVLFPDFRKEHFHKAVETYMNRDRRFGSIKE